MSLTPVDEAIDRLLSDASPAREELIAIQNVNGRILSQDLTSRRTHPPFNASAMDGYAVRYDDAVHAGSKLNIIGEAAAGHRFTGTIGAGQTVRIFTGAPVPLGADTVVIQENVTRLDDMTIQVEVPAKPNAHIRKAGVDFSQGDVLLNQFRYMDYSAITLAASMNYDQIPVFGQPIVSVLATGDELVLPGQTPGPDQIIASNTFGIMALAENSGAKIHDLGIAIDTLDAIKARVQEAIDKGSELLITIGGASVGDHDLVQQALKDMGMELEFWKIAMRPGKPLMFGKIGKMRVIGLPGNPASSLVTASLFVAPLIRKLSGRDVTNKIRQARCSVALKPNDHRQEYMRAHIVRAEDGGLVATPFMRQDSSLVRVFAQANGLLIRAPNATGSEIGALCDIILFDNSEF